MNEMMTIDNNLLVLMMMMVMIVPMAPNRPLASEEEYSDSETAGAVIKNMW